MKRIINAATAILILLALSTASMIKLVLEVPSDNGFGPHELRRIIEKNY